MDDKTLSTLTTAAAAVIRSTERSRKACKAVTLIELVVVFSIMGLMTGILLPSLRSIRAKARSLLGMTCQRQAVDAVNLFAEDNEGHYPPSIAKVGFNSQWNWSDPTKLAGSDLRTPGQYRSVGAYLRTYLASAKAWQCPSSPERYKYLQEAWDAGDAWDNPETPVEPDVVGGTYCLYWNYVGWLGAGRPVYNGPQGPASSRRSCSTLVISDYFGYNGWRTPGALASCESFAKAEAVSDTALLASIWYAPADPNAPPQILLHGGYVDGHVEAYRPQDVVPLRVIKLRPEGLPYGDDEPGPGVFFLPENAVP